MLLRIAGNETRKTDSSLNWWTEIQEAAADDIGLRLAGKTPVAGVCNHWRLEGQNLGALVVDNWLTPADMSLGELNEAEADSCLVEGLGAKKQIVAWENILGHS